MPLGQRASTGHVTIRLITSQCLRSLQLTFPTKKLSAGANGQKYDAASFFCPRGFDRAVMGPGAVWPGARATVASSCRRRGRGPPRPTKTRERVNEATATLHWVLLIHWQVIIIIDH